MFGRLEASVDLLAPSKSLRRSKTFFLGVSRLLESAGRTGNDHIRWILFKKTDARAGCYDADTDGDEDVDGFNRAAMMKRSVVRTMQAFVWHFGRRGADAGI